MKFLHPITAPFVVNQAWGVPNPIYTQFGFARHNGIDIALGTGGRVMAPHEGTVTQVGWEPDGAGLFIILRSNNPYEFEDQTLYCLSSFFHLSSVSVQIGQRVRVGDLLAIADSTGFSTGPHTHWRLQRVHKVGSRYVIFDENDANNSIDPLPYIDLEAKPETIALYQSLVLKLQSLLGLVKPKGTLGPTPDGLVALKAAYGDPQKPGFEANIVSFALPYPLLYAGKPVTTSRCHKLAVPNFQGALMELKDKGLDQYVKNYGGIYNNRLQRTGNALSTHAWGIAIDVEPEKYPLGSPHRLPPEVTAVFTKWGFIPGAGFPNPDPQHFQLCTGY